jgi:DNA-binding XRE family transcriptional regulator
MKRKSPRKTRRIGPTITRVRKTGLRARARTSPLGRQRIERGLSIAEVAARAGVAFVTVWRIETGAHAPTQDTLARLLLALSKPGRGTKARR